MNGVTLSGPETAVGQAVLRAREEIKLLREKLLARKNDARIDLEALEEAISKTEETLKRRTDEILHDNNRRPDVTAGRNAARIFETRKLQYQDDEHEEVQKTNSKAIVPLFHDSLHESPGENTKANFRIRVMMDPQNPRTRQVVNERYGIQLPLIAPPAVPQPAVASASERQSQSAELPWPRPLKQRKQLEVTAAMVTNEAHRGLLNLMERGLLPRATHLTLEPSPIVHRTAAMHDRKEAPGADSHGLSEAVAAIEHKPLRPEDDHERQHKNRSTALILQSIQKEKEEKDKSPIDKKNRHEKIMSRSRMAKVPTQSPATPAPAAIESSKTYRFTIQNGRVKEQSVEFQSFKNFYCAQWGPIVTALGYMAQLMTDYAIPLAFVNGELLVRVAEECDDEKPSEEQMLSCLANRRDVEVLLRMPGRRFMARDGRYAAAIKVQTQWRRFVARKAYLAYREKKWAAGVIAVSWILFVRLAKVRKLLYTKRLKQLEHLRVRNARLADAWPQIKSESHVIIHMPSLGYPKTIRKQTENLSLLENYQIGRLFEVADPNADIIYLSSGPVSEELMHYYSKLLSMRKAVFAGDQSQAKSVDERFRIIVPESIRAFQTHNMPLSAHLKYSPRALRRIKNFIKGRKAYIVPALPTQEDVYVADLLGLPLLSAEPDVAQLYSTKSGAKRILRAANVETAPFENDVYTIQQLNESFAQLVTRCVLTAKRFVFKMDSEHHSRGIATVDVAENLPCYAWAQREAERYGENWSQTWAQEAVLLKVLEQVGELLEMHAQPLNKEVYPTWAQYCQDYVAGGGVIEAVPPVSDAKCFTVDCLIEPNGEVSLLSSGDHVHLSANRFYQVAVTIPQAAADPQIVNNACMQIAEACKQRKIIGYFSVDFVTFIDPLSSQQVLWTTDVKLQYGENLANFQMIKFMTMSDFAPDSHELVTLVREPVVSPASATPGLSTRESTMVGSVASKSAKPKKSRIPESRIRANRRFAVASSRIYHSNFNVIQYSVLFQVLRATGIGYDIREQEGSLFLLKDPFKRANLTMITICDKMSDALTLFVNNLRTIDLEAAADNNTAYTNFLDIADEIEEAVKSLEIKSASGSGRQPANAAN